jgi:hypothetical protein
VKPSDLCALGRASQKTRNAIIWRWRCADLISPRLSSRPRLAEKQFNLWKLGIHALDQRIGFIRLAAVLAAMRR